MTTTERIHILDPSDLSATDINNVKILRKQHGMDFIIEYIGSLKKHHEVYGEIFFKEVQTYTRKDE